MIDNIDGQSKCHGCLKPAVTLCGLCDACDQMLAQAESSLVSDEEIPIWVCSAIMFFRSVAIS